MASAFKGSPSIALSELSSEMCNIGVCTKFNALIPPKISGSLFCCFALLVNNSFVSFAGVIFIEYNFDIQQVLSDWARDLVKAPPSVFLEAFNHTFGKHAVGLTMIIYLSVF